MSKIKSYHIGLEIDATDRTNATLRTIKNEFSEINENINNISLDELNSELKKLQGNMRNSVTSSEDALKYQKAYADSIKKSISELEKEGTQLTYMMTEAGKADRQRLKDLKARQTLTKEEQSELKKLQKSVIDGTDEEIKKQLELNRAKRVALKTSQLEVRETVKHEKTLKQLIKSDLSALKEKIKLQFKFISALKTTEGRYQALKKLGGMTAKAGGGAIAFGAGAAVAGVAGALGNASKYDEIEKALKSMKGVPENEKANVYEQLYIASGKSATEIVQAVNAVQNTLKSNSIDDIISSAIGELKFPGLGRLIGSGSGDAQRIDFNRFERILEKAQGQFGLQDSDISHIIEQVSNKNLHGLSQEEYIKYYAALKGSGAFDSDETLERALASFTRSADKSKDLDEQFKNFDFSRFVYGAQNKNQVNTSISNIEFEKKYNNEYLNRFEELLDEAGVRQGKTEAGMTAQKLRELEIKKDKLLEKFLPVAEKLISKFTELLNNGLITKLIDGLINFFVYGLTKIMAAVEAIGKWFGLTEKKDNDPSQPPTKPEDSNGGITNGATIVGERGRELVIPLEYSRRGRAVNIVNNFNQNFNMAGNQTTALSLSQAVRTHTFARSLVESR